MNDFKPGQKWISNAEPELGMGKVMGLRDRLVSLYFDLAGEERTYARRQAPLTRVRFKPGDRVTTLDGVVISITAVREKDDILIYHGDYNGTNTAVVETELDPNVRFSKPEERLFTHQIDDNGWFNLRYSTLMHRAKLARAPSRGLYGPRVSLIPHQLYIAAEVGGRFAPRVLLADEVGLGKTIEAGLIIHQQLQTGRSARVLAIVPQALTFQWFVEMIRRFNLQFTVLDEARCEQIEQDNAPEFETDEADITNPFEAQQLMLCSLNLFLDNPKRFEQVLEAEWDLVVVDEAHHLRWTPDSVSDQYRIVDTIARISPGLLLLTATPEQLGRTGHFARLRLLDPNRFHDFEQFVEEESRFETIADQANALIVEDEQSRADARATIRKILELDHDVDDDAMVRRLLDQHGTGRVLFRNVRSTIEGFPVRDLRHHPLPLPEDYTDNVLHPESEHDTWLELDPRVEWLVSLLQESAEKFLVICAQSRTASSLDRHLKTTTTIRSTQFHEQMDLVARDRSATYFAETDRGAQVMFCSEIGSEGRNFQFANQLVLFDLPLSPDLIEQRIGRLDRIGQERDVVIHIPTLTDSLQHRLFRWFNEGMDLFRAPNPAAQGLVDEFAPQLLTGDLERLIEQTAELNASRREAIQKGRDRLLELNSHRPDVSARLVDDVSEHAGGEALEQYMEDSFLLFGLESEPLGDNVLSVKPTESMVRNYSVSLETQDRFHYPELPEDGISITYDRSTALAREDVAFFTWESPIVQQALDLMCSDITGNSTMIAIRHPALKPGTLLLETLSVVDCIAPPALNVDRFLPPFVCRCLITPSGEDLGQRVLFQSFADQCIEVQDAALLKILDSQAEGVREMLEAARKSAAAQLTTIIADAHREADEKIGGELSRLQALATLNPNVRQEEISYLSRQREVSIAAIDNAEMRLDAVRVIVVAGA